jgi:hypothetical protein
MGYRTSEEREFFNSVDPSGDEKPVEGFWMPSLFVMFKGVRLPWTPKSLVRHSPAQMR